MHQNSLYILNNNLDLLRTGRSKRSGSVHSFDIGRDGWVQRQWLCSAVKEEAPGVRVTVPSLISVVHHGEHLRMEMFIDKPERGQSIKIESFGSIRATGGHAPYVNIDCRSMFSDRQEFDKRSHTI